MASYNRVIIVGNLTRDPELKQLPSGQNVCRLGVASNRQFRSRQSGEMQQEVCFVDVDVWGAQADSCGQYLEKGRQVLVEGRLKLDTWQDAEGKNRSKHSIVADRVVFMSSANDSTSDSATSSYSAPAPKKEVKPVASVADLQKEVEQIQAAKADAKEVAPKAKPAAAAAPSTGEVAFKDEPPFQDDLPF